MIEIISLAGPFGGFCSILGVAAAVLNCAALIQPNRKRQIRMAVGLATASFFVGVLGEGAGLLQACAAVENVEPALRADLWIRATAIARTATTVGAFWAALNAMLYIFTQIRSDS